MLHPLIGYTMKGVIWYQGEDNCNRYATYADQMQTLVNSWRKEWKQGIFPFYYCQIAPYDYSLIKWKNNSALLREKQMEAEKRISNYHIHPVLGSFPLAPGAPYKRIPFGRKYH